MAHSRRHLLRAAAAVGVGLAGCTGDGPSVPGEPSEPATTTEPCERAFGDRDGTDACAGVSFESVHTEPVSTATTEPGETPGPATFHDYLEPTVRTAGESVAVRGCVVGLVDGATTRRPVARTLPVDGTVNQFTVGPFDHHGIEGYHLWVRGCDASVRR